MRVTDLLRRRSVELAWAAFAAANLVAMGLWPDWETIPFHFVWISLTLVYGFRVWRRGGTAIVLSAVARRRVEEEGRTKRIAVHEHNPNTTKADVISKIVANRDAIRQRVVAFLSPEQLKKWDAEKAKAKDFLGQKIAA